MKINEDEDEHQVGKLGKLENRYIYENFGALL